MDYRDRDGEVEERGRMWEGEVVRNYRSMGGMVGSDLGQVL